MLNFDWGVFWAILAALAIKGIVGRVFRQDVEILRTGVGFVMRK